MNLLKLKHQKKGRDKSRELSLIAESHIIKRRLCASSRESSPGITGEPAADFTAMATTCSPARQPRQLQRCDSCSGEIFGASRQFSPFRSNISHCSFFKNQQRFSLRLFGGDRRSSSSLRRLRVHRAMRVMPYSACLNKVAASRQLQSQ